MQKNSTLLSLARAISLANQTLQNTRGMSYWRANMTLSGMYKSKCAIYTCVYIMYVDVHAEL